MKNATLTRGKIDRQLIGLALPLLAGSLVQQFYNTVDMMIVSRAAGDNAFAAVGVASSVMNLFFYLLVGLTLGFSILYANAYGAEDFPRLRKYCFTTGVISVGGHPGPLGRGTALSPAHPDHDPDPGRAPGGLRSLPELDLCRTDLHLPVQPAGRPAPGGGPDRRDAVCLGGSHGMQHRPGSVPGGGATPGCGGGGGGHRVRPGPVCTALRRLPVPALPPAAADPTGPGVPAPSVPSVCSVRLGVCPPGVQPLLRQAAGPERRQRHGTRRHHRLYRGLLHRKPVPGLRQQRRRRPVRLCGPESGGTAAGTGAGRGCAGACGCCWSPVWH